MQTSIFVTLTHVSCCACGTVFGVEASLERELRQNHKDFYCPNGHPLAFKHETEAERLKRELQAQKDQTARERHWREQADARVADLHKEKEHVENRLRGTRSVVTRMKRRIVAGRCTCCSRQFKDLERHMKMQHPKWSPDKAAEAMAAKP